MTLSIPLKWSLAAASLAALSTPVWANDTIARVGVGGLELQKTDDIVMSSELLEISQQRIHVKYAFRNESSKDIATTVAFPLPTYSWNAGQSAVDSNVHPLRPFQVTVAGRPVKVAMERKALGLPNGRDITDNLRRLGFTDRQIFDTFGDCTVESCEQAPLRAEVIRDLAGPSSEARASHADDPWVAWQVQETAHWPQVFPARHTLEVEHVYQPLLGGAYTVPYQQRAWMNFGPVLPVPTRMDGGEVTDRVCLDHGAGEAIHSRIDQVIANGASSLMVMLRDVEYVLGTGRNWKGPIRDFTLRIHKDPDEIVALCFPGEPVRRTPTLIEYHVRDLVPQDQLVVYFYTVTPGKD